ncbi:hypothetical protein As57867_007201, partial [Aphanomyces stellatus]
MALSSSSPPPRSGYLLKESTHGAWKTRFAVLDQGVLYCYKHKRDSYPKDIVLLSGCAVKPTDGIPGCSFAVSHASQPTARVYLATSDATTTADWIRTVVDHASVAAPPKTGTTNHSPSKYFRSMSLAAAAAAAKEAAPTRPVDIPPAWRHDPSVAVSPAYANTIQAMVTDFAAYLFDQARWEPATADDDAHRLAESTQLFVCGVTKAAAKSTLTLQHPAHEILDVLLDTAQKGTFDAQLHEVAPLEAIDGHTSVHHVAYKPIFPRRGRDFVVLSHWRTLADDSILLVTRSVAHDDVPVQHDMDRALLHMEGFHIVPRDGQNAADVTYVIHADANGLPAHVVATQALKLDALRAMLDPTPATMSSPRRPPSPPNA